MAASNLSGSVGSPWAACRVSVMNDVASSSRLSEITMPLGICDTGGGEVILKRVSGSGSKTVDGVDVDEDCSLILLGIPARFIAISFARSCRSREASPATDDSEAEVGGGVACAEVSPLGVGTLPS